MATPNIGAKPTGSGVSACCCSTPTCTLTYQTRSGTATLCGFSEYTTPSVPPKKYRTQTLSGHEQYCQSTYPVAHQCTGAYGGSFQTTTDHRYSGTYKYDASTCATTNTQNDAVYTGSFVTCGGETFLSNNSVAAAWQLTNNAYGLGCGSGGFCQTLTKTQNKWVGGGCDAGGDNQTGGTAQSDLSDEDTDLDAAKRAAGSFVGCNYIDETSCSSWATTRGAGVFSFNFRYAQVKINSSGLYLGGFYTVSVNLVSRAQGSSGAFSYYGILVYQFTAGGTTDTSAWIDVPMQDGLEIAANACTIQ